MLLLYFYFHARHQKQCRGGETDLFAGALAVQPGGNAHPVLQAGQDVLQILFHGLGAAGQVDDEGLARSTLAARLSIPRGVMLRLW